ncbi:MAG: cytochrome c oxidase accessory protein CcoG [Bacteroidetes bacterium]|nr:cytochrome c oxidase accessory protein CcoG [Bacteroidota bacterium]
MKTEPDNQKPAEEEQSFRDSIATIDEQGKRVWMYPHKPKGKYYSMRSYLSWVYLILFFTLPFIKVHGEPLFMINILERKFILFGMIFWPQDFFIFGLGMLTFIVFIALFTVVYGRVFCGWACPQTVFMEMVFRRIEYWIDGDANYKKALDRAPWNREKIFKRTAKYSLFFLLSFLIANTFLSYIIGVDEVIKIASEPISQHVGGFIAIIVFTFVFFMVYSWFREQVCLIVCPYGRMQGVLLDKDSIVVAYDYVRGEPRHKYKKNEVDRKGDCIDCGLCVKVCPTGIDIRNGTQLECVNCTACIDACDHMMESVNLPLGLIRYDSEKGIAEKKKLKFTTRMKAYTVVLVLLIGLESFLLISRTDVDTTILRAKGMLYQEKSETQISNLYTIKTINKTREQLPLVLKVENMPASVELVGKDLVLKPEGVSEGEFFIVLNKKDIVDRKTKLEIGVYAGGKRIKTVKASFLAPVNH